MILKAARQHWQHSRNMSKWKETAEHCLLSHLHNSWLYSRVFPCANHHPYLHLHFWEMHGQSSLPCRVNSKRIDTYIYIYTHTYTHTDLQSSKTDWLHAANIGGFQPAKDSGEPAKPYFLLKFFHPPILSMNRVWASTTKEPHGLFRSWQILQKWTHNLYVTATCWSFLIQWHNDWLGTL